MPLNYVRDDARRRIVVTVESGVKTSDYFRFMDWQRTEGLWGYGVLYDLRGATGFLPRTALRMLVDHAALQFDSAGRRGPVAIWAIDQTVYANACAYAMLARAEKLTIEVFRDREHAEEWLDTHTHPSD